MKFFKSKADINQSLDIVVPSAEIEEQVKLKLKAAQKNSKLKGFRKGSKVFTAATLAGSTTSLKNSFLDFKLESKEKAFSISSLVVWAITQILTRKMDRAAF